METNKISNKPHQSKEDARSAKKDRKITPQKVDDIVKDKEKFLNSAIVRK